MLFISNFNHAIDVFKVEKKDIKFFPFNFFKNIGVIYFLFVQQIKINILQHKNVSRNNLNSYDEIIHY